MVWKLTCGRKNRKEQIDKPKRATIGRPLKRLHPQKIKKNKEERYVVVKQLYRIIKKHTGEIGGNGSGGPIYGELTEGWMQKCADYLIKHTYLSEKSRWIDVGCGVGKPSLHVAQYPGVEFAFGIEIDKLRTDIGHINVQHVLKEGENNPKMAHNCILQYGDVLEAESFDPFTHIYMYDVGFDPKTMLGIAARFNNSSTAKYFISYKRPNKIINVFKFEVKLVFDFQTKMTGSSEGHQCYVFHRTSKPGIGATQRFHPSGVPCDKLFLGAWDTYKSEGFEGIKKHVDEKVAEFYGSTTERVRKPPDRYHDSYHG